MVVLSVLAVKLTELHLRTYKRGFMKYKKIDPNPTTEDAKERAVYSLAVTGMWIQLVSYFVDFNSFFNVLSFGVCIFTFGMIKNAKNSKKIYLAYSIVGIFLFLIKMYVAYTMTKNYMM